VNPLDIKRFAIAHGWHAATGVDARGRDSHTTHSLLRRMRILPESPVHSFVPLWNVAGPHAGKY
jgi:hypothetical protein